MYAVIRAGGRQFRVENNEEVRVDLLDADTGNEVEFKDVLLINDGEKTVVGKPFVKDALVKADVVRHLKDKKVLVFHKLPRKSSKKLRGHRQPYTVVKIKEIIGGPHGT
jgi:large subunit ribosomal protein L21